MEHSGHLHPEFGLLSPTPRLRRELRIAASSLLFGGIAGALCVSGVIALRHSDSASMEIAEAPTATASQTTASRVDARGQPRGSRRHSRAAASVRRRVRPYIERNIRAGSPSAIAPKARMVRIRKAVDSPAIARLPLGRSEAPAAAAPRADTPEFDASLECRPRWQ